MFEGVVAYLLNKYLGKYIKDLDSENLNVGIFNGTVQLTDLKLKAEALYELELPIEVKAGCIGKVSVDIPWLSLSSEPVLVHVEDVLILAGPVTDEPYDAEKERLLARARKSRRLELMEEPFADNDLDKPRGFFENLIGTIVNNVQVSVQNVHIRYEDTVTSQKFPFACGFVLQSLTAITTSSKWKPIQLDSASKTIYKLVKLESFSIYWSSCCSPDGLIRLQLPSSNWRNLMRKALQTFSVGKDDFEFILKPISAKVKIIFNKSLESKIPKLLVDVLLQDVATQLSRQQYLGMILLRWSFELMEINQRYRKYHPNVPCKGHAREWWKYAYNSVIGEYVRPFSWKAIKEHRRVYRQYKELFMKRLQMPNDTEVRVDVQMLEDKLNIANVLMAREEAKLELLRSEPNRAVPRKKEKGWWASWFGGGDTEVEPEEEIEVIGERERSFWSRLTPEEKEKLYEAIEYADASTEVPEHYIAHKINFTLANCTLSLVGRGRNHEVLVVTLTQFLTSLETRPGGGAFKISARTEGFVVEGASNDHDLVTVLSVDKSANDTSPQYVFALDFERNPLDIEADYGLMLYAEPVEVVYHEHSVSELLTFFSVPTVSAEDLRNMAVEQLSSLVTWSRTGLLYALTHRRTFFVNIEFKSPYFVVHEHGSFQKSGNILVIDMGKLSFKSELQGDSLLLEEATKMEIEEKLYDRFNICLSDIQVLFTDSGDEWRMARLLPESEMHLIPKIKLQALFSNSVKPDYRFLPRHKLNVSVSSLKLNLSDRRLGQLNEFAHNFPFPGIIPALRNDMVDGAGGGEDLESLVSHRFKKDEDTKMDPTTEELKLMRHHINRPPDAGGGKHSRSSTQLSIAGSEQYLSASDYSDEEQEVWGRALDVPGFDDNVSASNTVNSLLRFVLGEVALHLSRSSDQLDKPYLMLRLDKLCADVALMEYGPAVQASISGIHLVDKLHIGPTGEYLELLSSKANGDMVSMLYRKVKASCPEFKSDFHQVEHSLIVDLSSLSITFHREALLTLGRYLLYVYQKLNIKEPVYRNIIPESAVKRASYLFVEDSDPPVPPGSTKLSLSLRVREVKARLCDVDVELADISICGLECDYVQKANEKLIVRVDLTHLSIDDLMESTLYSKVLSIEDDKLFDFKYVRKAPHTRAVDVDEDKSKIVPDGNVRLHIGRLQLVLLRRFFVDVQRFLEPFLLPEARSLMFQSAEKAVQQQVADFAQKSVMLQLSIDIRAPTILVPQKSDSPNLVVLSLGDLNMENFFKEVSLGAKPDYVDNILIRLSSLHMTRAIVLLDGTTQSQESILEPTKLNLDIKRALTPYHRNILEYEVRGTMDLIKISIGQKDLGTILAIFRDNFKEKEVIEPHKQASTPVSPPVLATPTITDDPVKKLATFLTTSVDVYKKTNIFFTMEGLHIVLYADGEDVQLSSPVRDPLQMLSKLELEEVTVNFDLCSDQSLEVKCSLQSLSLEDTRSDSTLVHTRVFHSSSGSSDAAATGINVSSPNMIDVTYRQTPSGDAAVDVLIEETSLKVSVPYLLAVLSFVHESLLPPTPSEHELRPVVEGAGAARQHGAGAATSRKRLPSDNTSGYHSAVGAPAPEDGASGLSFSLVLKKPEIVFFADPRDRESEVIVLKMDIMLDYCRNLGQHTMTASVIGLNASSFLWGRKKDTHYLILKPFNIELNQTLSISDADVKLSAKMSDVAVHISAPVLSTVVCIMSELLAHIKGVSAQDDLSPSQGESEPHDLWCPTAVSPPRCRSSQDGASGHERPTYPVSTPAESLEISIPKVTLVYENYTVKKKVPVLFFQASVDADVHDWSKQMYLTAEAKLEALYYCEERSTWEPLIDPVMELENHYRPWELVIKMFKDRSYPILSAQDSRGSNMLVDMMDGTEENSNASNGSMTSSDDASEEETEMTVIRKHPAPRAKRALSQKSRDSSTLVAVDSDSENDENVLQRIAHAFGHLFSDQSSEGEQSDEGEGAPDVKSESEETETADNEISTTDDRPVFLGKEDAPDSTVCGSSEAALSTYILIDSRDELNINVTPTLTQIISRLLNDIERQKTSRLMSDPDASSGPLAINNLLGPEALVSILRKDENERFVVVDQAWGQAPAFSPTTSMVSPLPLKTDVGSSFQYGLQSRDSEAVTTPQGSHLIFQDKPLCDLYKERTTEKISLEVAGFEKFQCWMPRKAGKTVFALHPMKNKMRYFFIVEVSIENGRKTVTTRSPLRLENHLPRPVQLLCARSSLEAVGVSAERYAKNPFHGTHVRLATLAPKEVYHVPLFVAYHSKIYLQPSSVTQDCAGYELSTDGLWSQDIALCHKSAKFLSCKSKNPRDKQPFWMKVVCKESRDARVPALGTMFVPNCTLHVVPPIVIHNSLPYPIELHFKESSEEVKLDEGDLVPVFSIAPNEAEQVSIEVPYYLGSSWRGQLELSGNLEEAKGVQMQPQQAQPERMHRQLCISIQLACDCSLEVFLYSPYWVINKTGLPLQIRGSNSDVIYDSSASSEELLLFRFKKRKHKKQAKIRVYNSSWSSSFCLDTVGNNGVVVCKDKERNKKYRFFLKIQMSKLNLSKIISITPFFLVVNNTRHYFRFMEENEAADLWFDIGPLQCLPFWPDTDSMKMYVRHKDSNVASQHFCFKEVQNTVLRMDSGSAVCVEVSGGVDGPMKISLFPYHNGDAPVRVENLCEDLFLKIHQKCLGQVTLLSPYQSVLYTWDDPTLERTLMWNLYNRKKPGFMAHIGRDGFGKEKVSFRSLRPPVTVSKKAKSSVDQSSSDDDSESENGVLPKKTRKDIVVVYWISFLDHHQRVLLFTQDERIWKHARKAVDGEKAQLECFVSLHGVTMSLMNGALVEVALLSFSSSPALWEVKVNDAWKPLTLELASWLEYRWRSRHKSAELKDYVQVDLEKMQMTKPFYGSLQRSYRPALWLQYRQSEHQALVLAKVHRLQLDNQLPDAVFPTAMYRFMPQERKLASSPRPLLEVALLVHHSERLNLNTVKYLKVLLQEVYIKLDKGFLLSVYDIFSGIFTEDDEKTKLKSDMKLIYAPLHPFRCDLDTSRSGRTVFEFVHLSPVKIHLSFSPRGTTHKSVSDFGSLPQDILDVFLNSIGATLSEVKDVELRMAYFEQKGRLETVGDLLTEVKSHYISQVVQQCYVLILGLDVLGNPYGLVKDFTRGLGDFFYEPIAGSIHGPEEFAEGLARGAQSLLGHVIGSSAGSVSLITGSLGQVLAVLSFDDDYQNRRRQRMEQHPGSLPEALALATRGFVHGILLGVSGVVMSPIAGAQLDGPEGFFKGVGKGLLGLITKPAGGVVDMFSIAFDGIRRAAEMGKGVIVRHRLPRFINPNLGLRPFSQYQATGYRLLLHLSKGHYSETDVYWAHAPLGKDERASIALLTDRHLFLLEKCRFWGGWDIQWSVRLEDILSVPTVSGNSLVIKVRQDESLASFTGDERHVVCEDQEVLEWLKLKVEKVLLTNMEERPCSLDS
ncbi:vacuolar protein sorting-associated protein 13A isoform X4 [Ixodes scapularis]